MRDYPNDWGDRNRPIRLTQCCTQFTSPGVKIVYCICIIMWHSHLNVWKFLKQKVLFPKGLNWVQHWVSRISLLPLDTTEVLDVRSERRDSVQVVEEHWLRLCRRSGRVYGNQAFNLSHNLSRWPICANFLTTYLLILKKYMPFYIVYRYIRSFYLVNIKVWLWRPR